MPIVARVVTFDQRLVTIARLTNARALFIRHEDENLRSVTLHVLDVNALRAGCNAQVLDCLLRDDVQAFEDLVDTFT
jgi:hypothetical protein